MGTNTQSAKRYNVQEDSAYENLLLIPWPKKIATSLHTFHLYSGVVVDGFSSCCPLYSIQSSSRVLCSNAPDTVLRLQEDLRQTVRLLEKELIATVREQTGNIWRIMEKTAVDQSASEQMSVTVILSYDPTCPTDGYRLTTRTVACDNASFRVCLRASNIPGLRSAIQTLRQLIISCGTDLPELMIDDWPDYPNRGYLLDVTRGRVPTLDWLEHWADLLELYKYNHLELYVEDSFAFSGMESVWGGMTPLTASDIIQFDQYCADRGIELVPCLSTFGHLYSVLRSPQFAHLGEFPEQIGRPFSFIERQEHHTLNITDKDSFALSRRMIDEFLPLFRSKKFNICGDETFDLGKGRSKKLAEKIGTDHMYAAYINRLCTYLRSKGHQPLMWGDIVLQQPKIIKFLTGDPLFFNWQYAPRVEEKTVKVLQDAGVHQWVCAATHAWNSFLPALDDAWGNITSLSRAGIKYGAEGFIVTDWGDYGHVNDPHLCEPALLMGAECAWNACGLSEQDDEFAQQARMRERIDAILYGAKGAVIEAIRTINPSMIYFSWADAIRYLELDSGDGKLNTDVAASMSWVRPGYERIASAPSLSAARKIYLEGLKRQMRLQSDEKTANDNIACDAVSSARTDVAHVSCLEVMRRALALSVHSDSISDKDVTSSVPALLVCTRGQDLFNRFGHLIVNGCLTREAVTNLCVDLRRWYKQYQWLWRTSSRESQLFRIQMVIDSMIALLRQAVD